jgi:HEPN domain
MPQVLDRKHRVRYPRTHDLMALVETLDAVGEDTSSLRDLVDLNPFAVEYRYELFDKDDEELNRATLILEVETLFASVAEKVLPSP